MSAFYLPNTRLDDLQKFFEPVDENSILKRRETNRIEFKEFFDWSSKDFKSKIAKSAAGFANNKGGSIFFGIKNSPHEIVGIENFDFIDDAEIATYFNTIFSPSISFEKFTYSINNKNIGILSIEEQSMKPIICFKDTPNSNVGDIFFRYTAQTDKIKAGDLQALINEIREKETQKWLRLLEKASTIGVDNLSILNTVNGELTSKNNTFLIDESLLKQIKFINKYSSQEDGSPAIKVIGEIPGFTKIITQAKNIYPTDIFESFIRDENVVQPTEYLKAICHFSSQNYPFYYLLRQLGATNSTEASSILESIIKDRSVHSLKKRLRDEKSCEKRASLIKHVNTTLGKQRQRYYSLVESNSKIDLNNEGEAKAFLECLYKLNSFNINLSYLNPYLQSIYESFYPSENHAFDNLFRYMLTHLDWQANGFS